MKEKKNNGNKFSLLNFFIRLKIYTLTKLKNHLTTLTQFYKQEVI